MNIGILHYSLPPAIGGVERVIQAHVKLFRANGHAVECFSQNETPGFSNFGSMEENRAALLRFIVSRKLDLLMVHNVFTMPFCPIATEVCCQLAASPLPVISWVHDLAATNNYYSVAENDPIRRHPAGARVVTISQKRAEEYRELTGFQEITIVPNGVDTLSEWTGALGAWKEKMRGAFPILFHPTRLLRRKNIGLGIRVIAELKKLGLSPRLLISGAAETFSGDQTAYRNELGLLVTELGVNSEVVFFSDTISLSESEIQQLYQASDALFFPSEQEGFGLPVLEAALHRLPLFVSREQPLADLAQENGIVFDTSLFPEKLAGDIQRFFARSPSSHVRQRVRRDFDWQGIYQNHILPLITSQVS